MRSFEPQSPRTNYIITISLRTCHGFVPMMGCVVTTKNPNDCTGVMNCDAAAVSRSRKLQPSPKVHFPFIVHKNPQDAPA